MIDEAKKKRIQAEFDRIAEQEKADGSLQRAEREIRRKLAIKAREHQLFLAKSRAATRNRVIR